MLRIGATHPDWAVGFEDEVWWSRLARPALHAWSEAGEPLRLQELTAPRDDPDPKALACYGLLMRLGDGQGLTGEEIWLRFVEGRPVSGRTIQFLDWCSTELEKVGKKALLVIWDNASWHISGEVRGWIKEHNRAVKRTGKGVRLVLCRLPSKSPWLNRIEPKWVHGKRRVVEPERLLTARELVERVYDAYDRPHLPPLPLPKKVS